MEALTIILCFILILSISINIVLVWYAKKIIPSYMNVSDNFSVILSRLHAFRSHLEGIYQMELFYGDETLKGLLKHNLDLINYLKTFEDIYSFTNPDLNEELEDDIEDNIEEEKNEKPKSEFPSNKAKIQKILY